MYAPTNVIKKDGIIDVSVITSSGKLGVKADLINKKRLDYYNTKPIPKDFLFWVDDVEIGKSVMEKYKH